MGTGVAVTSDNVDAAVGTGVAETSDDVDAAVGTGVTDKYDDVDAAEGVGGIGGGGGGGVEADGANAPSGGSDWLLGVGSVMRGTCLSCRRRVPPHMRRNPMTFQVSACLSGS